MPSLPWVMNEDMSYTVTPTVIVLSPPAALGSPAPQPARPSAATAVIAVPASSFFVIEDAFFMMFLLIGSGQWGMASVLSAAAAACGPDVDADGGDDDHAFDDVLPVGGDKQEVQAVVDCLDQQQPDCGAPYG